MNPVGLFLIGAIILGSWFWYRKQPAERRGRAALKIILLTLTLALLYLTVTGRIHWIGALFAALLPLAQKFLPLILRFLPFLKFLRSRRQQGDKTESRPRNGPNLTRQEALDVLGLKEGASREDIIQAHRKLIQKIHPDRGGSDWLAAKINAAKSKLLD